MYCAELKKLIAEYEKTSHLDKKNAVFVMELRAIDAILAKCGEDEVYSGEIARKFCHLVSSLKREMSQPVQSMPQLQGRQPSRDHFMAYRKETQQSYRSSEELLCAFYNRFRNEAKKPRENEEQPAYPPIRQLEDLKDFPVNITMRDYVARIRTFVRKYMWEVCEPGSMAYTTEEEGVLHVYHNIEYYLAAFDTKSKTLDGQKVPDKQKVNVRSALRKLNQFKQEQGR